jgi:LAS superfamily LD-carboxypeptidase LdcB
MATEKELQDEMERLRAEVQGLTTDLEEAKTGLRAFGKATATGAYDLTKGMGSLALNVGRGDTSFKSLNSVVDIASNALSGMAKAIPFAGEALAAGIQATAAASKFMLEQMDNTAKAFNDLGRVGALTESGMSGLQKQFIASGLSLDVFKKQVGDNAQALARFGGMTGDGAEAFSKITGSLTELDKTGKLADNSLRRLGLSTEDIGAAAAAFVTQQTRLGLTQGRSNAELAAGTKAYAIELDALQKVTGLSREAIQKQQDAALSESRFRANYDTLIAQGKENEAKALMKLQTQISAIGPEAGQGVRDLLSGAGTDAARKLMASTGGAAQDILDRVKEGKLDETQAALELQQAMKKTADAARNNAQYVDKGSSAFLDYAQQSDLINAKLVNGQLVRERQDKQMAEGTDELTDQTIDAQKSMEGMNREMQKLGFTFLPQASKAVAAMTGAMKEFVKYVNETIVGDSGAGGTAASGPSTQQSRAAQSQTAQAAPAGQTNQVSQTMVTNTGGGAAMVFRGRRGGAKGGGAGGGGPEVDNSKEAVATAGGLIKGSLSGVNKGLVDALVQAVTAYGKPITVTSGLRSNEEQQKLYDDFVAGRSKFPAAKPGESKHNTGNAVDISLSDANALADGGFLKAAGLGRPVKGDPVHIQQVSAANGAILSGPMGGYKPNLTMHGTEAIVPLNTPTQQAAATGGMDTSLMSAQLDRLDEMVSLMKNQLGVSTKIMQYNS